MKFLGYHSEIELSLSGLKDDFAFGEENRCYGLYNISQKQIALFVPDVSNPHQATYAVFDVSDMSELNLSSAIEFANAIMPIIQATKVIARKGYQKATNYK